MGTKTDNAGDNGGGAAGIDDGNSGNAKPFEFIIDATAPSGNAQASADTATGGKRKYTRRAATGTAAPKSDASLIRAPIKDLIMLLHTGVLTLTHIPEVEMSEAEATKLADLSANVARHYDIAQQSQKALDWTALIMGVGAVYTPRVIAFRMRMARAKEGTTDIPNIFPKVVK